MQGESAQAEAAGAASERAPLPRSRRDDRRPRRPRPSGVSAGGMTLALAFEALRDVLLELGAVGEEATDADQVRERMAQRAENPGDPIFERNRFQRMLRQAHDAGVIELAKSGETYMLKLGSQPVELHVAEPQAPEAPAEEEPRQRRGGRRRGERGRRGGRGGRERADGGEGEPGRPDAASTGEGHPPPEHRDLPDRAGSVTQAAPLTQPGSPAARPNPRFRRGSRGAAPAVPPVSTPREPGPAPAVPSVGPPELAVASGGRSLRHRAGSHSRRMGGAAAPPSGPGGASPAPAAQPEPAASSPAAAGAQPRVAQAAPTPAAPPPAPEDVASRSGFLKRVSAALQKAVRGQASDSRGDT